MANFTITVGANTVTKTISASDATRLINAYGAIFARFLPPSPTNAQIFTAWTNDLFDRIREEVKNHEKAVASQAASDGVPDLVIS